MKDTEYCMGIRAHIKPILGEATASATPRIKPPPTHVAAEEWYTHTHTKSWEISYYFEAYIPADIPIHINQA